MYSFLSVWIQIFRDYARCKAVIVCLDMNISWLCRMYSFFVGLNINISWFMLYA